MIELKTQMIYNLLSNRKRPVTRERLCNLMGLNDRTVREEIQHLRDLGKPVMHDKVGNGYRLARTEEERDQIVADYEHRIKSMRKTVRALKRAEL